MAKRGRPPLGVSLIDRLAGSEQEKRRLRAVFETMGGELTIPQAASALGIEESRFHEIRREALQAALDALAPGLPGRPPQSPPPPEQQEIVELRAKLARAEAELVAARLQTELLLGAPRIFRSAQPASDQKKNRASKRSRRKGRRP